MEDIANIKLSHNDVDSIRNLLILAPRDRLTENMLELGDRLRNIEYEKIP